MLYTQSGRPRDRAQEGSKTSGALIPFCQVPEPLAAIGASYSSLDGGTGPVCTCSSNKAGQWLNYLGAHSKRVYAVATNGAAHSAKALADKIKTGALKKGFRPVKLTASNGASSLPSKM